MKNIFVVELKVHPSDYPEASFDTCMRQALELAATEWRNVRLFHGGKEYLILANDIESACRVVKKDEILQ